MNVKDKPTEITLPDVMSKDDQVDITDEILPDEVMDKAVDLLCRKAAEDAYKSRFGRMCNACIKQRNRAREAEATNEAILEDMRTMLFDGRLVYTGKASDLPK